MNNSKYLFIVDLIVLLYQKQELTIEYYWMPLAILCRLLRQDGICSIVQTVCFNLEEYQVMG